MHERSAAVSLALLSVLAFLLVAGGGSEPDTSLLLLDSQQRGPRRPEQIPADAWLRMLQTIEAHRYAFRSHEAAGGPSRYEAINPQHDVRITFSEDGVRLAPSSSSEAPWEWTLQLVGFGYEGELEAVAPVAPVMADNRVEYRHGALTEWYLNDRRGLEQGFTVAAAPPRRRAAAPGDAAGRDAAPPLLLEMRAEGLETRQEVAGESILLSRNDRHEILRYHGLVVFDAEGDPLPAEMWATDGGLRIAVLDAGASYPLTIDPLAERTILRASDAQLSDGFGSSVSISGDTAIVGARFENGGPGNPLADAGAAYVFERNQGGADNWGEVKKLMASDPQANDWFGTSVSISGDRAIVGARSENGGPGEPLPTAGAAYVFERDQGGTGNWGEVRKLTASDAQQGDLFGHSVAISGDTAIVGAFAEDGGLGDPRLDAGAAYVFERNQGGAANWGEARKLTASDAQADDQLGYSVAISGDTAIVGAIIEDGGPEDPLTNAGAAYVFERDQGGAGNWGEAKKLMASDAQAGDLFGASVSVSGDRAIVGAFFENGGPGDPLATAGAAYVFSRDQGGAGNWGQAKKLTALDAQAFDHFGYSVSISGDVAIVGARLEDVGPVVSLNNAGAAYAFERNEGGDDNWGPTRKLTASDAQAGDDFGYSVSVSGDTAIIAAFGEDGGTGDPADNAGAAYVFEPTVWALVLDGFGGLHGSGIGVVPMTPAPPYFGFDIVRDAELAGDGAYVLDGVGGVHAAGGAPALSPGLTSFGFDIGKDLELAAGSGAYALDGFGGVHAFAGAPLLSPATPYFGFDVARDLELGGGGYYVLDGFGGLHNGASATPISPSLPYFGFDIARDLELIGGGGAYALDGYGGVHALGGAAVLVPTAPYFGFDVARDLEMAPDGGYFVLDGFGGLHSGGGASPLSPPPPYFGFDIARDLEIR